MVSHTKKQGKVGWPSVSGHRTQHSYGGKSIEVPGNLGMAYHTSTLNIMEKHKA